MTAVSQLDAASRFFRSQGAKVQIKFMGHSHVPEALVAEFPGWSLEYLFEPPSTLHVIALDSPPGVRKGLSNGTRQFLRLISKLPEFAPTLRRIVGAIMLPSNPEEADARLRWAQAFQTAGADWELEPSTEQLCLVYRIPDPSSEVQGKSGSSDRSGLNFDP